MLLFWHYYDKSVSEFALQSYVCLDKAIKEKIQASVAQIKRLEQSGDKYVMISQQLSRLTQKGLLRLIAYLLVSAKNEKLSPHTQRSVTAIDYEDAEVFSHITLWDLQDIFIHFYDASVDNPFVNRNPTFAHVPEKLKHLIKSSVDHIKLHQSAGENLVVVHPPKKALTDIGFKLLRSRLSVKAPEVSASPDIESTSRMKPPDNSAINSMINSVSTLFTSAVHAMSTTKSNNLELEPINSRTPLMTPPTTTDKENRVAFRGYGATGQTVVPILYETPSSIFTVDEEALKDFYVTCKDVETLGKELFKVDVKFIDKKMPQKSGKKENQLTLFLSVDKPSSIYFCFDPFHLCAKRCISQRMVNFSKAITSAALSKQHISELFKPFLSPSQGFFSAQLTEDEKIYVKLARDVVDKCQQTDASVVDVLNMMNNMQAQINASKTKNKEQNKSREEFLFRLEYIYFLQYGKGYDQVQAINREKQCLNVETNNHIVEKPNAQPG